MEEYIVVSKKYLTDLIKQFDNQLLSESGDYFAGGVVTITTIINESKPLQPILEDAFAAGSKFNDDFDYSTPIDVEEYIQNLKID